VPKFLNPGYLILVVTFFLFYAGNEVAQGQDVLVTFYSHGSFLTTGIPGTKQDIYIGSIFDGPQRLFGFRDGFFAHNNRYITFHFAPGQHTFGASNGKHPETRETLSVDLKAGDRYFIRAQGESKGVPGVFEIQHGRLDLMSCTEAQTELAKAKPLGDKALSKAMRPQRATLVVDEIYPFSCH
jgi:hypothetical protein